MADISVTAANVRKGANAISSTVTGGVAVTAGQLVYKRADTKWVLAKATSELEAGSGGLAIALSNCAKDQPLTIQTRGKIDPGGTVTVGDIYLVSDNAGGIRPHDDAGIGTGDFITIVGIGTAADEIDVAIRAGGVAVP